jgi:hypothetical protein
MVPVQEFAKRGYCIGNVKIRFYNQDSSVETSAILCKNLAQLYDLLHHHQK